MLGTIMIVALIVLLIGALPKRPYSTIWDYYLSGGCGIAVVIVLMLALSGGT